MANTELKSRVTSFAVASAVALLGGVATGVATPAKANSGESRSSCIQANRVSHGYSDSMKFTNVCGTPVFIIYCGETLSGGPSCQGGRNSNYFTHSLNVRPGMTASAALRKGGDIRWGACDGTIGFGNDGYFTDSPDGRYGCLPR
jgi:hypothetical protein